MMDGEIERAEAQPGVEGPDRGHSDSPPCGPPEELREFSDDQVRESPIHCPGGPVSPNRLARTAEIRGPVRQAPEERRALEDNVVAVRDSRRAALNTMEGALAARDETETLNADLRREVSERRRREEQIAKLTRLYMVLSQVNEAIVRSHDTDALFGEVCRIVAEKGNLPLVWIGRADKGEVTPVAAAGPAVDYLRQIKVELDGPLGNGPTGTCLREDRPVVNDDFGVNPATTPWREAATRCGFRASAAFPLRRQGKTVCALTLYSCDPYTFDAEQLALLDSLAADVSYAIDAIEQERLRVRAERELAEAHQRIRAIMEAVPVGISFSDDSTCQRISGNPSVLAQFAARPEDNLSASAPDETAAGRQVRFYKDGQPIPDHELPLQRAVAENRPIPPMEFEVELPGGQRWYAAASSAPIRDGQGNVVGGVAVTVDLTERKRAEERTRLLSEVTAELLASDKPQRIAETLCRRVMEHLGCHVFFNFLVDDGLGRLHLNACAGVAEETVRQIEWLDFGEAVCGCVARDGCRLVASDIQNASDPRADLVRSLGIQAYACHPLMEQNRVIGTLSFGSRSKPTFADEELDLMKTVADHVAVAMQRVRLLESLERHARAAEAANAAKSQFLANMSHELRTPMNAILGMIDLAIPKAADPMVQSCLQTARDSADLLLMLLNDLLDSAKIESGKLELESAPFSLRRMLDQITQILSVRASEKGLVFSCHVPEDAPDALVGDRMRLQQVLLNLAGNAVKFTEHGQVEINLSAAPDGGEVFLAFAVQDTGIGIAAADQQRLFEPFAQADATMVRRFGGTGLGLSISKNLVEMMGGRISVESEPGVGSTFSFALRLPLARELPAEFEAHVPTPAATRRLRILLAEDNPANQKVAACVLRERGHTVEIAHNGHEAVSLACQNRYDAILMDVQMPGMTGLEATAVIRKHEAGSGLGDRGSEENRGNESDQSPIPHPQSSIPRVPIIAMTAHAMPGDRQRCLAGGMDGYLPKPIDAREMIAMVEAMASGMTLADLHLSAPSERESAERNGNRTRGNGPRDAAGSSGQMPESPPIFDPAQALKRCLGRPHLLAEMIQFFLADADTLLVQIRAELQRGDMAEVGRLGHRLKGTIAHLAAEPARAAAERVERAGLFGGTPAEVEQAVDSLERECHGLESVLIEGQAVLAQMLHGPGDPQR
jgi:signal transduction histidine kinase/DNA-binding response OmpR family regulator/PAS domain-containing protein/HPt (histidine-containing phosphotransfer) domain-containing protein